MSAGSGRGIGSGRGLSITSGRGLNISSGSGLSIGTGRGLILPISSTQSEYPISSIEESQHAKSYSEETISISETQNCSFDSRNQTDSVLYSFKNERLSISSGRGINIESRATISSGRGIMGVLESLRKTHLQQEHDKNSRSNNGSQKGSSVVSKPESEDKLEPIYARGTKGTPVTMLTNYIRLDCQQNFGVYEYEVRFSPNIEAKNLRFRYLSQHKSAVLGETIIFDGVTLYLPIMLPEHHIKLVSEDRNDGSKIEVKIIYRRKKRLRDCTHLFNLLFDRIYRCLNYTRIGRKNFDPSLPKLIPQHKLEIWPGYVNAVEEQEGGIMLCLDVSHRVLCQQTVLELLSDIFRKDKENFQQNAIKALVGCIILTRYNNKTYRIDDIDFDNNPESTFQYGEKKYMFKDYFKKQYEIELQDLKQPLLINRKEVKMFGLQEKKEMTCCLIPEICYLTGMTDTMRNDFTVMKDLASHTRLAPNQRVNSYKKFISNVNNNPEAKKILQQWDLSLADNPLTLEARQFDEQTIIFGKNRQILAGAQADFDRAATSNQVLEAIDLQTWLVVYTDRDRNAAKNFIELMLKIAGPMGISVSQPLIAVLNNDRTETYVQALRKQLINSKIQLVVIIFPTARDDRYAAVKKVCCVELPVASQVINARTLRNESKNRSIVQKIALQMNCKMGGTLWSIKIPLNNVMICGIDTYHEAKQQSNSVSGFVASLNGCYTRWYSKSIIQNKKEELVNGLTAAMQQALAAYSNVNRCFPGKIIVYRDGVSDGQLEIVEGYEIPQLKTAFEQMENGYKPTLTYIVVQKRINTKFFMQKVREPQNQNPLPGTIIDHTVTRKFLVDFFLISQSVRQGTVSPSHYIVLEDENKFSADILQRLTYKLCFLYYNWPGTVRVPACTQYAHKLAQLIGMHVKRDAAEKLCDKLYYL